MKSPQLAQLPISLRNFDKNGDGRLSASELRNLKRLSPPELKSIEEQTAYAVVREIMFAAKAAKEKLVPTEGINFEEFRILGHLYDAHSNALKKSQKFSGVAQLALVNATELSKSTISALLDKLDVDRQSNSPHPRPWISRSENPESRREKLVRITHEGIVSYRQARKEYKQQLSRSLLDGLELEQLIALWTTLYQFNSALNPSHGDTDDDHSEE